MKTLCAAVLAGLTAVAGAAGAETAAVSPAPESVTIQGEVLGYAGGTMYLVGDGEQVCRVDLGEKGGRLLRHTPFSVTGTMEEDDAGAYLKMEKVDYADPDPFAEYAAAKASAEAAPSQAAAAEADTRDAAYDHGSAVSGSRLFYVSGQDDLDTASYPERSAEEILQMEAGTKASFTGRAVRTVEADVVMLFWDMKGTPIEVRMNGTYIPLGQRCTVYGTVEDAQGTRMLSAERLESVG